MSEKRRDTFIFRGEWLDEMKHLPQETQSKIITDLVMYGTGREPFYTDDPIVVLYVNAKKGSIDFSNNNYLEKMERGGKSGPSKKVNDVEIERLARNLQTAEEIAKTLGVSVSTVYHSEGWKNRNLKG